MGCQPWAPDDQLTWLETKVPEWHASQNDEKTGLFLERTEQQYFTIFWTNPDTGPNAGKYLESMLDRNGRLVTMEQRKTVSTCYGIRKHINDLRGTVSNSIRGSGTAASESS